MMMPVTKVTVILGPQGSGKTTLAKEMTKGRTAVWIPSWCGMLNLREVDAFTEVIVLDECIDLPLLKALYWQTKFITINPNNTGTILRRMPEIIATSTKWTEANFKINRRQVNVIKLEKKP